MHYKRFISIITLLIIASIIHGCGFCNIITKQYIFTKDGNLRPAKNRFKLGKTPYMLKDDDLIKTNCVYQSCTVSTDEEYTKSSTCDSIPANDLVTFFRFFKNGRFLISHILSNDINAQSYNTLKGDVGYYTIENGDLILEYFSVNFGGMASDCGRYYTSIYTLRDDAIIPSSQRVSNNGIWYAWEKIPYTQSFKKIEIKNLTTTPDW
ncbi:hypothetical protein [Aquimarina sp. I32.4]|uniref:hypothetical protein n=1 Tax=Aquimarina sp. I32.4 TaxID=2053903 RepID=UPI000CDEC2C5|nr:hypothetical protein [Aquimarina sp. I32.4]